MSMHANFNPQKRVKSIFYDAKSPSFGANFSEYSGNVAKVSQYFIATTQNCTRQSYRPNTYRISVLPLFFVSYTYAYTCIKPNDSLPTFMCCCDMFNVDEKGISLDICNSAVSCADINIITFTSTSVRSGGTVPWSPPQTLKIKNVQTIFGSGVTTGGQGPQFKIN